MQMLPELLNKKKKKSTRCYVNAPNGTLLIIVSMYKPGIVAASLVTDLDTHTHTHTQIDYCTH
jgi:hypothetical protein